MTLTWKLVPTQDQDGWVQVALAGAITESAQLNGLIGLTGDGPVRVDLSMVEQINSCGVREWLHFVQRIDARNAPIELVRCPPTFVRQLNMISNFAGGAEVRSVLLPYWCPACGHDDYVELSLPSDRPIPETRACASCGQPADFDDVPDAYLAFQPHVDHAC